MNRHLVLDHYEVLDHEDTRSCHRCYRKYGSMVNEVRDINDGEFRCLVCDEGVDFAEAQRLTVPW